MMALGFGGGGGREAREKGERERERKREGGERDTRLHSSLDMHAAIH